MLTRAKEFEIPARKLPAYIYNEMCRELDSALQQAQAAESLRLQAEKTMAAQREAKLKLDFTSVGQRWLLKIFFRQCQKALVDQRKMRDG